MARFDDLLAQARTRVTEIQPWDLVDQRARTDAPLLLDVRKPALACGRDRAMAVICRSGALVDGDLAQALLSPSLRPDQRHP